MFKAEGLGNDGGCGQEKLMLTQLIICQHGPEQAGWHQWQVFLMGPDLSFRESLAIYSSRPVKPQAEEVSSASNQ